ncbi:MAG: HipA domain-containing protein [Candidatus Marinimicrobia bacterium]|nr:HipA domain-containing protein [Candidatus Neomarinimicrobiota bacterium]
MNVSDRHVILLERFDHKGSSRIPFLSGMSMLGALDHENRSYLELVDALHQFGAQPKHDIQELWRRIVFTILVTNVDDHMRNHGFVYRGFSKIVVID